MGTDRGLGMRTFSRLSILPALFLVFTIALVSRAESEKADAAKKQPLPGAENLKPEKERQEKGKREVWVYDPQGRRDPFCYTSLTGMGTGVVEKSVTTVKKSVDQQLRDEVRENALMFLRQAESAMVFGDHKTTMDLCDNGLELYKKLESLPKDKAMTDELREIRDSLSRLKKAAERLVSRRQAETAFRNLGVRVTGVVWQPTDSRAVVNGQVVRKGNILAVGEPSAGEHVYVEDILPEQVIVNYRGYKMRLSLGSAD